MSEPTASENRRAARPRGSERARRRAGMTERGGELGGLKAIVTGGAEGIGRATAELMRGVGADVAVLDRAIEGVPARSGRTAPTSRTAPASKRRSSGRRPISAGSISS